MLAFLCSFYSNCWFESTRSTMRWRSVGVGRSDTSIYRQTTSYLLWRAVNRGYPADSQQDPGGSHRKLSFPRVCLCNYLIEKPQISKQAATMVTVGNPHPHLYTALVAPPQPPFLRRVPNFYLKQWTEAKVTSCFSSWLLSKGSKGGRGGPCLEKSLETLSRLSGTPARLLFQMPEGTVLGLLDSWAGLSLSFRIVNERKASSWQVGGGKCSSGNLQVD